MRPIHVEFTIYMDLDGVMANLDKFVYEYTGHWLTYNDNNPEDQEAWEKCQVFARENRPFYSAFEMMPDAQELWDYVKPYKPRILTATGPDYEYSTKEKNKWVNKHLDNFKDIITVRRSAEKAEYANHKSILIDDRMVSIGPWTRAGGIGILHTSAHDTIDRLRQLGL